MADYLVISCSLNPESNSRLLCHAAFDKLKQHGSAELIDLRDHQLPVCDGGEAYGHPDVTPLSQRIAKAKCVLLGTPIYNYDVNAAAKNLVELTGNSWTDKIVGFLCAAGGRSSYMSVMSFANSLMLDFRCLIIPRYVYADQGMFGDNTIGDVDVLKRIDELVITASKLTKAINA